MKHDNNECWCVWQENWIANSPYVQPTCRHFLIRNIVEYHPLLSTVWLADIFSARLRASIDKMKYAFKKIDKINERSLSNLSFYVIFMNCNIFRFLITIIETLVKYSRLLLQWLQRASHIKAARIVLKAFESRDGTGLEFWRVPVPVCR